MVNDGRDHVAVVELVTQLLLSLVFAPALFEKERDRVRQLAVVVQEEGLVWDALQVGEVAATKPACLAGGSYLAIEIALVLAALQVDPAGKLATGLIEIDLRVNHGRVKGHEGLADAAVVLLHTLPQPNVELATVLAGFQSVGSASRVGLLVERVSCSIAASRGSESQDELNDQEGDDCKGAEATAHRGVAVPAFVLDCDRSAEEVDVPQKFSERFHFL